eukprot:9807947-Alexandrium_andersonii.AAC.1
MCHHNQKLKLRGMDLNGDQARLDQDWVHSRPRDGRCRLSRPLGGKNVRNPQLTPRAPIPISPRSHNGAVVYLD